MFYTLTHFQKMLKISNEELSMAIIEKIRKINNNYIRDVNKSISEQLEKLR